MHRDLSREKEEVRRGHALKGRLTDTSDGLVMSPCVLFIKRKPQGSAQGAPFIILCVGGYN